MKKLLTVFVACLVVISFLIFYSTRLLQMPERNADLKIPKYRFSLIVPLSGNRYWSIVENSVKDAARKYSVDVKCMGSSHLNTEEQVSFIRAAIASRVDGIITAACDSPEFGEIVSEARSHGIPVILVDSDMPATKRNMYIGTDNIKAGQIAGQQMIRATGGSATIAVLVGSASAVNQQERVSGFKSAIAGCPNMRVASIVEGKSDLPQIIEKVNDLFDKNPDVNAVFCAEGFGPVGTGEVIHSRGLTGKVKVIGFDDLRETIGFVSDGTFSCTIVQQPQEMGALAVQNLLRYAQGGTFENAVINTSVVVVSQKQAGLYKGN